MNGTLRTILISVLAATWAGIHLVAALGHLSVPSSMDPSFTSLVGVIMVSPRKPDKPKD